MLPLEPIRYHRMPGLILPVEHFLLIRVRSRIFLNEFVWGLFFLRGLCDRRVIISIRARIENNGARNNLHSYHGRLDGFKCEEIDVMHILYEREK